MVLQLTTVMAFAEDGVGEPRETVGMPSPAPGQPFVVAADLADFTPASAIETPPEGSEYQSINNLPADYRGPQPTNSLYGLTENDGPLITAKNVVLPVRFHGEEEFTGKKGVSAAGSEDKTEYFTQDVFDSLGLMYRSGKYNLADFFSEMTFGEIEVETTVAHGQGGARSSYETTLPRTATSRWPRITPMAAVTISVSFQCTTR